MSLRVVPLPAGAAEPLSLMHAACFPDDPWDALSVAQLLALYGVFGHVAWLDGIAAGFVVARDLGGEAEILTLGVLPGLRRRGVGRALLGLVLTEAAGQRIGSIVLEVAADNGAARRLYEAMGFIRVGARARYYRRGGGWIDALILRLPTGAEADLQPSCLCPF
jgi:ribosomal-protein-alanine N-acetyltransferase